MTFVISTERMHSVISTEQMHNVISTERSEWRNLNYGCKVSIQ